MTGLTHQDIAVTGAGAKGLIPEPEHLWQRQQRHGLLRRLGARARPKHSVVNVLGQGQSQGQAGV